MSSSMKDVMLHYVETTDEAAAMVRWIGEGGPRPIAVDTETTGLERTARIRLIQFGDRDTAWTLRADRWAGPVLEALDRMKRDRGYRIVFHNASYDVPKLERLLDHDFDWGQVNDTMLMSRLANPVSGHGLKSLATRLIDKDAASMQRVLSDAMLANKWTWETVPYDYVGYSLYAGIDCVLTARLLDVLEERGGFNRDLYATEMTVAEACVNMEEVGMMVDVEYCKEQVVQLEAEIDDILRQAWTEHGVKALGSNQLMIDKLHQLGFTWDERTESGKIALTADVLDRLYAMDEEGRGRLPHLIHAYRMRVKMMNTYFMNFLQCAMDDGCVHPDINTLEAITGRMSISNPSMQNLYRGPRVRHSFVARPGNYMVLADYSQVEYRLLAHYAGDPALMEAIKSSDVYRATAAIIYGGEENVSKELRQLAKVSIFSLIYGAGAEKFSYTAGVTIEEGQAFLDAYHGSFPHVKPFLDEVVNRGRARHRSEGQAYVTTKYGRRVVMRKTDAYYTLVNYLIQGSAADVLKHAIVRLWNAGFGEWLRLPVHDEMILEVPDEHDPEEVKKAVDEIMFDPNWNVAIVAESAGPYSRWSDKYLDDMTVSEAQIRRRQRKGEGDLETND